MTAPAPAGRAAPRVLALLLLGVFAAVYAHAPLSWPLGLVLLLPWLQQLGTSTTWRSTLLSAWSASVVFCVAVFHWFGAAFGGFTGTGVWVGLSVLVLAAPLLQPQFFVYALARRWAGTGHGRAWRALIASAAWVATEAFWPKLLGDTLGHGLHGAAWLRQTADLFGASGLTLLLLLSNEALFWAWQHRHVARSSALRIGAVLMVAWCLVAAYGGWRRSELLAPPAVSADSLRVALVQGNQTDYERRRQQVGAYAVVREALDTHYALSWSARRDHGADALVWSETVYPTTFGQARSVDGAALDAEIQGFVDAAGVPLVFGSYDADAQGEYNAAFFLQPDASTVGAYRKTHPFPFSEHVPGWLDSPWLRRALPWTGGWQPGNGARVLPLRSRDGRSVEVAPLICLDAVYPQLAIDGARLGAQALLSMSNDSWFTNYPAGARLHLQVAAFRSVETALPQLRVTTNGYSAIIDATGDVLAQTGMDQQAVLTGELRALDPPVTLMVRWGDWVGRVAALGLLLWAGSLRVRARQHASTSATAVAPVMQIDAPVARYAAITLRAIAALALAGIALHMAWRVGWQVQTRGQLQAYALLVVLPLVVAAAIHRFATKSVMSAASSGIGSIAGLMIGAHPGAHRWLDHGALMFGLFPLLPALLAFRLHQMITFGSAFGEWLQRGASDWLLGLTLWWASWSLGLMLMAAGLRLGIEIGAACAPSWRNALESSRRALFYLGVPAWLLWRMLSG